MEIIRRLTTISGTDPAVVWDAKVVDDRGRVYWVCDHGHRTGWSAHACASKHLLALHDRGCPAEPFSLV